MDLIQQNQEETLLIKAVDAKSIELTTGSFTNSLIIDTQSIHSDLNLSDVSELTSEHVDLLLKTDPEIIIFGSGVEHSFPDTTLLSKIAERNIGFEVMTNQAAARTYNILKTEGRKLACLLII